MITQTYTVKDANGGQIDVKIDIERQVLMVGGNPLSFENARQLAACINNLTTQNMKAEDVGPNAGQIMRYVESVEARIKNVEANFDRLNQIAGQAIERVATAGQGAPTRDRKNIIEDAIERVRGDAAIPTAGTSNGYLGQAMTSAAAGRPGELNTVDPPREMPPMPSQTRREYRDDGGGDS